MPLQLGTARLTLRPGTGPGIAAQRVNRCGARGPCPGTVSAAGEEFEGHRRAAAEAFPRRGGVPGEEAAGVRLRVLVRQRLIGSKSFAK